MTAPISKTGKMKIKEMKEGLRASVEAGTGQIQSTPPAYKIGGGKNGNLPQVRGFSAGRYPQAL